MQDLQIWIFLTSKKIFIRFGYKYTGDSKNVEDIISDYRYSWVGL